MADYIYISKSNRGGELGISRKVFARLASTAVNNTSVKNSVKVKDPVRVVFRKDGRVSLAVKVSVKKGLNVNEVCQELQKEIAHSLEVYAESVPFEIVVLVDEIK